MISWIAVGPSEFLNSHPSFKEVNMRRAVLYLIRSRRQARLPEFNECSLPAVHWHSFHFLRPRAARRLRDTVRFFIATRRSRADCTYLRYTLCIPYFAARDRIFDFYYFFFIVREASDWYTYTHACPLSGALTVALFRNDMHAAGRKIPADYASAGAERSSGPKRRGRE